MPLLAHTLSYLGNWFAYGYQPNNFRDTWIRMANITRTKAPKVALVWSPNTSVGYPFGVVPPTAMEDFALLDSNNNGQIDALDDPYTPYWPGDEYVDVSTSYHCILIPILCDVDANICLFAF
jgi:beta-mannanase